MKNLPLPTKKAVAAAVLAALMPLHAMAETTIAAADITDSALLQTLPGFTGAQAVVNGIALHYVIGGKGEPLVLLPGWPETWWGYHKIMPELAKHYTVIAVDMRGQGGSGRPDGGYDKKTMAADVLGLVHQLGYNSAHIAGHDIGSQVAYSYAANFPQATRKLVLMDVAPSTESLLKLPMLPQHGTFGDKIDPDHAYLWWFAFHQVKGLPEQLLAGRVRLEQEWFYNYMAVHGEAIDARDRAVYEAAYNSADAIRASNGWYQSFTQDIIDDRDYQPLAMPVLALGAPGFNRLKAVMEKKATRLTAIRIEDSGHFVQEEQPAQVLAAMLRFLGATQP
jgi:pimeloyl-ACP methyl ester carboxylesterase